MKKAYSFEEALEVFKNDFDAVLSILSKDWKEIALAVGAIKQTRGFKSLEDWLRVTLMHILNSESIRSVAAKARLLGLYEGSPEALFKYIRKCGPFFQVMNEYLLKRAIESKEDLPEDLQIRYVDGTVVTEPGRWGSSWKIHMSFSAKDYRCDFFKVTKCKGVLTGESLAQFDVEKNDCLVGDRAYSTYNGIALVSEKEAYGLVRWNSSALPLYTEEGERFNLLERLKYIKEPGETKEWDVYIRGDATKPALKGRICVIRKTDEIIRKTHEKIRKKATKKGTKTKDSTFVFNEFIIVYTNLPHKYETSTIFELYRKRWQIELYFKRMKSLLNLGFIPKTTEQNAYSWIQGKLFCALLIDRIQDLLGSFSPWGLCNPKRKEPECMERISIC